MSKRRKELIQPTTFEEQAKEARISFMLCDAEKSSVVEILKEDRSSIGLMHVLNNATGFAEKMALRFRDPRTPKVDCKQGCSWCCYQTVPVSGPEALAIAAFLMDSEKEAALPAIREKLVEVVGKTKSLNPRERTKAHIGCAFLKNEQCSIYPVRPLSCGEFTSMNVNDCKRGYRVGFKPKGIVHEKARMVSFNAIRQGLLDGLREALPESSVDHYELAAAVLAAMSEDAAERWLTGERIFAGAKLTLEFPAQASGVDEEASFREM